MKIHVQADGQGPARIHEAMDAVRDGLRGAVHLIARVVLRLRTDGGGSKAQHRCDLEVHLADGRVEVVQARQRHLGAAVRRALAQAWAAVVRSGRGHGGRSPGDPALEAAASPPSGRSAKP